MHDRGEKKTWKFNDTYFYLKIHIVEKKMNTQFDFKIFVFRLC